MNGIGHLSQVSSYYFITIHFYINMFLQSSSYRKSCIIGMNRKRIMTALYQHQ